MTLYAYAQAPEAVEFTVVATSDFDPTSVSAWALYVWDTRGTRRTWAVTVEALSSTAARLRHVFAEDDLPIPGDYAFELVATTPAGERRWRRVTLEALEP